MHVVFIEPSFPANQWQFVRGLYEIGAKVTAIGELPAHALPSKVRNHIHNYIQVPSVVSEKALYDAVKSIMRRERVDRLEATVEAHVLTAAKVRELLGIEGTSYKTTFLCRDKPSMKEYLRKNGIPTALSSAVNSREEALKFAKTVGFPIIVKPRSAAGALGTAKVNNVVELERALVDFGIDRGHSVALEEFVEGHEGFIDTLTVNKEVVHYFISHYYPNVLTAMRNRFPNPYLITTNRVEAPGYTELKELNRKVINVMGIETSATHLEWFFGPKGLKFSEIACRPPGVSVWDLYCYANDFDLYKEWARAITIGRTAEKTSRRFSAGMVTIRPDQDGRIVAYKGVETTLKEFGNWIIDYHFPPIGSKTQPIEAGYFANAWVRMRHPDYDILRKLLEEVGKRIKIYAE